jgi:sugar phosphate isomerase/epimerase
MTLNRRTFLKQSAIATTASLLLPSCNTTSASSGMRIGFQVWSIAKELERDFLGSVKLLSQIGYQEIELFGPYPFSSEKDKTTWSSIAPMVGFSQSGYFGRDIKEFNQILKDHGLRTPAMHIGLDTLRNNMDAIGEAAHQLGQTYVGIAAIPEEERGTLDDYKRVADDFNVIGERAKAKGIRFYYHNHGYGLQPIEGTVPFDMILERTDPSLVFFEMDIFWTVAGGADPVMYLDANPGRFKLMHVKDMKNKVRFSGDGGNPQQWVELFPHITDAGMGVLDLKTILAQAKKSGVEHFILENDVITNPKESLEKGYQYLASQNI